MRTLGKLIFYIFSNTIALLVTVELVQGFELEGGLPILLTASLVFTIFNIILKPILKLLFGPLIILTFGLFIFVINALIIGILDFVMEEITIEGLIPLAIATLIFSIVNSLVGFSGKSVYKN